MSAGDDDKAMQALSDAGAQCGDCGDQPGDRICPDCERCYGWYVTALRAAGWAPRAEVRAEDIALIEDRADDADFTEEPLFIVGLRSAADLLKNAAAAPVPVKTAEDETARPVTDATTCPHCGYTTTHCGQCGEDMTEVTS